MLQENENAARNKNNDVSPSRENALNGAADLREAIGEIHKDIKLVIQTLNTLEGPSFDDRLKFYRKWALEVGRYSFRWHLSVDQ